MPCRWFSLMFLKGNSQRLSGYFNVTAQKYLQTETFIPTSFSRQWKVFCARNLHFLLVFRTRLKDIKNQYFYKKNLGVKWSLKKDWDEKVKRQTKREEKSCQGNLKSIVKFYWKINGFDQSILRVLSVPLDFPKIPSSLASCWHLFDAFVCWKSSWYVEEGINQKFFFSWTHKRGKIIRLGMFRAESNIAHEWGKISSPASLNQET